MLVSCIAYTNGIDPQAVLDRIDEFDAQTYSDRQLIIINNYDTLERCQSLSFIFHHKIVVIDRPGYTNGQAIQSALQYAAGQIIAPFPFDWAHYPNRLETSVAALNECEGMYIAPVHHLDGNIIRKNTDISALIPEMAVYKSPAYTVNYDINYGAWWSYPMMLEEQGLDLFEMHTELGSRSHE